MKYKAIFIDCDKTLLNDSHALSEENAAALKECAAAGISVILCSGRSSVNIMNFINTMDIPAVDYFVAFNGCLVCGAGGGVIRQKLLKKGIALEILAALNETELSAIFYNDPAYTVAPRETEWTKVYYEITRLRREIVPECGTVMNDEIPKVLCLGPLDEIEAFRERMQGTIGGRFNMFTSARHMLEFTAIGALKGDALVWLAERMGIAASQVAAIGDNENDISMIRAAGIGAAVANALPSVKEAADVVTRADNNGGAVAEFVREHVIGG